MSDLAKHKSDIRREAGQRRKVLCAAAPNAGDGILARFLAAPLAAAADSTRTFAGYWPIRSEVDPRPLMRYLAGIGLIGSLPVVTARSSPLAFRRWSDGQQLEPGPFGVQIPSAEAEAVIPELLLVPLLAYDDRGHRLGYGAGYYDRTLGDLRRTHHVLAVGLAFAGQRVDKLPAGPRDEPLDWVVTERDVIEVH